MTPRPGTVMALTERLGRRLVQLLAGLLLYGLSIAVLVRANLGLFPWDVLHQGIALRTGLSLGVVVVLMSALVLLAWIPLRQLPGIGTVLNAVLIGVTVDVAIPLLPEVTGWPERVALMALGIGLNAVATAAYIGAHLGPGPRDGLMTGLVRRTGAPVRRVRTGVEIVVVALGWALGGTVGVGTVLYALLIGPLVQPLLPLFAVPTAPPTPDAAAVAPAGA